MTATSNTPSGDAVNAAEPVPDAALPCSETGTGKVGPAPWRVMRRYCEQAYVVDANSQFLFSCSLTIAERVIKDHQPGGI